MLYSTIKYQTQLKDLKPFGNGLEHKRPHYSFNIKIFIDRNKLVIYVNRFKESYIPR